MPTDMLMYFINNFLKLRPGTEVSGIMHRFSSAGQFGLICRVTFICLFQKIEEGMRECISTLSSGIFMQSIILRKLPLE